MATGIQLHQIGGSRASDAGTKSEPADEVRYADRAMRIDEAWRRMLTAQRRLLDDRDEPRDTARERCAWHLIVTEALIAHSRFIRLVREAPE